MAQGRSAKNRTKLNSPDVNFTSAIRLNQVKMKTGDFNLVRSPGDTKEITPAISILSPFQLSIDTNMACKSF